MSSVVATAVSPGGLAAEHPRGRAPGWWGMALLLVTEATTFATLLASYFYLRFTAGGPWPPGEIEDPKLLKPIVMTVLLLTSSGPMVWADFAVRRGHIRQLVAALSLSWILGAAFLALQTLEYREKLSKFTWSDNVYGSIFYTITGFHGLHVITGLLMIAFTWAAAVRGMFTSGRHERVRLVAFYWHFIDAVWVFIFLSLYLSPHL